MRGFGRLPQLPAQPDPLVGSVPSSDPGLRTTVVAPRSLGDRPPSTDHSLQQHVELRPAETFFGTSNKIRHPQCILLSALNTLSSGRVPRVRRGSLLEQ